MTSSGEQSTATVAIFPMAPLIRFTLISLYLALVLPLPVLAPPELQGWLWAALPLGLVLILALVSEQVELSDIGIRVGHPAWCRWWLRRGWHLQWEAITGLTPVNTSQGGKVFYVRTQEGSAYLLPQRVQAFDGFLSRFSQYTGLNTSSIGRISPPWTYQLLASICGVMLGSEITWLLIR
ncbi:hypothetical protein CB0101_12445 [Synechococcus sp. CB0101]|uniref:hypothetical protein n=1 Tax=Synechococcus sp. CB0101 TaxID=232348 RepID=UPI0002001505|nr:hypothetical protein [Synechococcus sp. CB0101]QCH15624.1 hypothetical protein CB0101_12445 [Synechococcus sp. CB0101]